MRAETIVDDTIVADAITELATGAGAFVGLLADVFLFADIEPYGLFQLSWVAVGFRAGIGARFLVSDIIRWFGFRPSR